MNDPAPTLTVRKDTTLPTFFGGSMRLKAGQRLPIAQRFASPQLGTIGSPQTHVWVTMPHGSRMRMHRKDFLD